MKRALRFQLSLLILVSTTSAAQAQANLVHGIGAAINLGRMASKGGFSSKDKTMTIETFRDQNFPMKRTPVDQLSGEATDQISFLEGQLDQCHKALFASATGPVLAANQLALIQTTQRILADARPTWNQKFYKQELAFYQAEDGRRQQSAAVKSAPLTEAVAPK